MPNQLIHESSPYLLQHAHNPVEWYPWGEDAMEKARQEDKLMLVSIGYAACHWCHVMEHESFEDESVAEVMNQHFVCVKIDREERPDVDKIYMNALTAMTGRGGWPLNMFALPDGRPVSGGTYFPKEHWLQALDQLAKAYRDEREKVMQYATNLTGAVKQMGTLVKVEGDVQFTQEEVGQILEAWLPLMDMEFGGRKVSANKFPLPANITYLIRSGWFTGNQEAKRAAQVSLEKMALGGIYDQVGGGFARYSVDTYWKVPHFEKMLYDNAQLIGLYAEAFQEGQKNGRQDLQHLYRNIVFQTIEFANRELRSPEGGFYASLDADSEGEEGKFYTWSYEELAEILGEDFEEFATYYNVGPGGNWEGKNILFALETEEEYAKKWKRDLNSFSNLLALGRQRLLEVRAHRVRPGLDDKILASWNGLMLAALAKAYQVFQEPSFLKLAQENAEFLLAKMVEGNRLFRSYKEGTKKINGFLDDYANVIDGLIGLYQVSLEERWLFAAKDLLEEVYLNFNDEESGMFFYTSKLDPELVDRSIEVTDDVVPASNSVMAINLQRLGILFQRPEWVKRSQVMLLNVRDDLLKHPSWYANWALLHLEQVFPRYEVVTTGPEAHKWNLEIAQHYQPGRLFAGSISASSLPLMAGRSGTYTNIFICQNNVCQLPVASIETALEQLGG
ncbi:MAG: thioredoxin domain-containing protein [Bacteroidota bacterium]